MTVVFTDMLVNLSIVELFCVEVRQNLGHVGHCLLCLDFKKQMHSLAILVPQEREQLT